MQISANWNKFGWQEAFGDAFADTVGIAPVPTDGPGGTMLYSFLWAVDATSDAKEEGLGSPALPQRAARRRPVLHRRGDGGHGRLRRQHRRPRVMTENADDYDRAFIEEVTSGRAVTQPNIWQASEVDRILRGYIDQAWAGTMTPEDALAQADAEITAILSEAP
jgi:multiple sugar transport system substrate-binding protein